MDEIFFLDTKIKLAFTTLPVRTTIINLKGKHIVISPGSQILEAHYLPEWNVTDIIAPNLYHAGGIHKAQDRYKKAKLWGSPGIEKKIPSINWNSLLGKDPWPYEDSLPLIMIEGMPQLNEGVFFHRKSKSLIVTDLCFNLTECTGLGAKILFNLTGTYNRFAISRLFASAIKDKTAFLNSMEKILSLDFQRIIMSHGLPLEKDARLKLRNALSERSLSLK